MAGKRIITLLEEERKRLLDETKQLPVDAARFAHGSRSALALMEEVKDVQEELAYLERVIRNLKTGSHISQAVVLPGQYRGFSVTVAMQAYLSHHRGQSVPATQLLEDLRNAGVMARQDKPEQKMVPLTLDHIRIACRNRPEIFEFDAKTASVRLTLGNDVSPPVQPSKSKRR